MVLLESITIPLGTKMVDFEIKDPKGKSYRGSKQFNERGLLVAFTCNHCPYAIAVWPRLVKLAQYARNLKINTIAINPNINADYPEDAPERMMEKIKEWGIDFPYLVDETQEVAKTFKAQCTPDIYLFNKDNELVYHGRVDDNWQNESSVGEHEMANALRLLSKGEKPGENQNPSIGCSIKWV